MIGIYANIMKKEINEPKIKGIDRNNIIVAEYIGCRIIPYNPVSILSGFPVLLSSLKENRSL